MHNPGTMMDPTRGVQPRRRKKGPVRKPPDRPMPLPDTRPARCALGLAAPEQRDTDGFTP